MKLPYLNDGIRNKYSTMFFSSDPYIHNSVISSHNSPFINMDGLYEMSLTSWKLKWTDFMLTHLSIKIRKNWIQFLLNGAINNNESWDLFSLNYYILSNMLCTKNMAYQQFQQQQSIALFSIAWYSTHTQEKRMICYNSQLSIEESFNSNLIAFIPLYISMNNPKWNWNENC